MARTFTRDGERLTCDIRPARGGFDLVFTQDGEHHVEHFANESQARVRGQRIEADLLHDGWRVALAGDALARPGVPASGPFRRPSLRASDDGSAE